MRRVPDDACSNAWHAQTSASLIAVPSSYSSTSNADTRSFRLGTLRVTGDTRNALRAKAIRAMFLSGSFSSSSNAMDLATSRRVPVRFSSVGSAAPAFKPRASMLPDKSSRIATAPASRSVSPPLRQRGPASSTITHPIVQRMQSRANSRLFSRLLRALNNNREGTIPSGVSLAKQMAAAGINTSSSHNACGASKLIGYEAITYSQEDAPNHWRHRPRYLDTQLRHPGKPNR